MRTSRLDLIKRIGKVKPARRRTGQALHRPILLLWAISQAVHGQPREQPWSAVKSAVAPLLTAFADAPDGERAVVYPFWALQRNGLWQVAEAAELPLTSDRRRPKTSALDAANPLAGLSEEDYDQLVEDPELAAWAIATLLLRFFTPAPAGLLEALSLTELMEGRIDSSLHPTAGEPHSNRDVIADAYGGNRVLGITPLADGVLTVYSDDKGPYADQRIPGMDWIAYTGDGLSGDQMLAGGNRSMAEYQDQQTALRYWHKPHRGHWTFETWAVIVQRRLRWGRGQDGEPRREFVWVLAPVPSPLRETWTAEVVDALNEDDGWLHDDSLDVPAVSAAPDREESPTESRNRYRKLNEAAHRTTASRSRRSKLTQVERYLRSPAARQAVILRSDGQCENPACLGHPSELTDAGLPILEVDHVNDLGRGGQDTPETMIALCPNCHALKTRGSNRHSLRKELLVVAGSRHQAFLE